MAQDADGDADRRRHQVARTEWIDGHPHPGCDTIVCEEPLEIRLGGVPIAVVMRTPGHDEELVRGFLVTEGIVPDAAGVASVRHCPDVDVPEAEDNVVQVVLAPEVEVDVARLRRNFYVGSSCGVCGKASIDRALATAPALDDRCRIAVEVLYRAPDLLRARQEVFSHTGGLHAAGLVNAAGEVLVVREDVGRHNAVDKVVGWASVHGPWPPSGHVLVVSGRVSFEMVQKALAARIPVIAGVSAPSSLAVDLGTRAGVTVIGFLRRRRLCVYAGEQRIEG